MNENIENISIFGKLMIKTYVNKMKILKNQYFGKIDV